MLCKEGPDPPNVVQGKSAGLGSSSNVVCAFQLIINYNARLLADLDGVMDDEPS